jgi:hypothetical protein
MYDFTIFRRHIGQAHMPPLDFVITRHGALSNVHVVAFATRPFMAAAQHRLLLKPRIGRIDHAWPKRSEILQSL